MDSEVSEHQALSVNRFESFVFGSKRWFSWFGHAEHVVNTSSMYWTNGALGLVNQEVPALQLLSTQLRQQLYFTIYKRHMEGSARNMPPITPHSRVNWQRTNPEQVHMWGLLQGSKGIIKTKASYPLLNVWGWIDGASLRRLCDTGLTNTYIMPEDTLFLAGEGAGAAYCVTQGNLVCS
eukprot:715900-Amphidinium_carterae.2